MATAQRPLGQGPGRPEQEGLAGSGSELGCTHLPFPCQYCTVQVSSPPPTVRRCNMKGGQCCINISPDQGRGRAAGGLRSVLMRSEELSGESPGGISRQAPGAEGWAVGSSSAQKPASERGMGLPVSLPEQK